MSRFPGRPFHVAVALAVGAAALAGAEPAALVGAGSMIPAAQARVGRPATPMSYAGVARRTTRRSVAVGAAATSAYATPYAAPGCVQVVDAYGRIYLQCP